MRTYASVLTIVLCLVGAPRLGAQEPHTASPSAIDAALQQHVAATDADRDAILRLLARPEVSAIAADAGIDLRKATSAVSTLDPQQLRDVAGQARHAEDALAGGQSRVTISTTLIIIGLLVLILLIVALD